MTWLYKLLDEMTPGIVVAFKTGMRELLQKLYEAAHKTPNKWDDWGVKMIAKVFDVELVEPVSPDEDEPD